MYKDTVSVIVTIAELYLRHLSGRQIHSMLAMCRNNLLPSLIMTVMSLPCINRIFWYFMQNNAGAPLPVAITCPAAMNYLNIMI